MQVIQVDDDSYYTTCGNGIVVLDFYADWCQPCKPVAELLEKLAVKYPTVTFCKANVERCPKLVGMAQISNIPTVYIIVDGEYRDVLYSDFGKRVEKEIRKHL